MSTENGKENGKESGTESSQNANPTANPNANETDWTQWSKNAVGAMFERNSAWRAEHGVPDNAACRWDLANAALTIERPGREPLVATVCLVGTTSNAEGTFLWSWANAAVPPQHGQALELVREFGAANGLGLLTTPMVQGGRPEATECLCVSGYLQRAIGTLVDQQDDVGLYFTLLHIHGAQPAAGDGV